MMASQTSARIAGRPRLPDCTSAGAEPQDGGDVPGLGDFGTALPAHEIGKASRQFSFGRLRELREQHCGDRQPQDAVAEKLETLVAREAGVAGAHSSTDVGQRRDGEVGLGEPIADPVFECGQICPAAPAHRTSLNRRFHRTDVGQRQNSQSGASSLIEKKINSARPTKFSNGT